MGRQAFPEDVAAILPGTPRIEARNAREWAGSTAPLAGHFGLEYFWPGDWRGGQKQRGKARAKQRAFPPDFA